MRRGKKKRLMSKAQNLPDNDLLNVLRVRCEQKATKEAAKQKRAEMAAAARAAQEHNDTEEERDDK